MEQWTVKKVMSAYLIIGGFDGLYYPDVCSCEINNLFFCCGDFCQFAECRAGYIQSKDSKTHSVIIGPKKQIKGNKV